MPVYQVLIYGEIKAVPVAFKMSEPIEGVMERDVALDEKYVSVAFDPRSIVEGEIEIVQAIGEVTVSDAG